MHHLIAKTTCIHVFHFSNPTAPHHCHSSISPVSAYVATATNARSVRAKVCVHVWCLAVISGIFKVLHKIFKIHLAVCHNELHFFKQIVVTNSTKCAAVYVSRQYLKVDLKNHLIVVACYENRW